MDKRVTEVAEKLGNGTLTLDGREWRWQGEGSAHLVVAHMCSVEDQRCHKQCPWAGVVLRVQKEAKHLANRSPQSDRFKATVMDPLLGVDHTVVEVLVPVQEGFIQTLYLTNMRNMRPGARLLASSNCVGVQSDLTCPPDGRREDAAFVVDLKPKAGFVPSAVTLSEGTRAIKSTHCRYCMHQILKQEQGKADLNETLKYCPVDLFSEERGRVVRAVRALTSSPQNNLRLLVDGEVAYGAETPHEKMESTLQTIVSLVDGCPEDWDIAEVISDALLSPYASSEVSVLRALLECQLLDFFNIENIYDMYTALSDENRDNIEDIMDSYDTETLRNAKRHAAQIVKDAASDAGLEEGVLPSLHEFGCCSAGPMPSPDRNEVASMASSLKNRITSLDDEHRLMYIYAFLVSTTAKDVSVFITIDKRTALQNSRVTVVDLDRKPTKKIQHYFELDQDIFRAFTRHKERCQGSST